MPARGPCGLSILSLDPLPAPQKAGASLGGHACPCYWSGPISAFQNEEFFLTAFPKSSGKGWHSRMREMLLGFPTVLRFSSQLINSGDFKHKDR